MIIWERIAGNFLVGCATGYAATASAGVDSWQACLLAGILQASIACGQELLKENPQNQKKSTPKLPKLLIL